MYRNTNGSSLTAMLEIQLMTAIRRGWRSGATAISVHHAKNSEPNGMAVMLEMVLQM